MIESGAEDEIRIVMNLIRWIFEFDIESVMSEFTTLTSYHPRVSVKL